MTSETGIHNVESHSGDAHVHIVSPALLLAVFGGLIALTILTVTVSYAESSTLIHLGWLSIWVALAIAVVKAALVALYFMHLRWDSPFNGAILIIALVFVVTFIGFAVLDTSEYHYQLAPPSSGKVMDLGADR
ncbi:MAG: cytochrome C oxidase subunit IV family protein [Tepidisphaeraceae bacterium]